MLSPDARGPEYAELIARIYRDDQRYGELVKSSRAAFESRLNWDVWGKTVTKLIHELLAQRNLHTASTLPAEMIGPPGAV